MEKERKTKIFSIVALVTLVITLTVAFASLSEMLTITGTATLNAASWNIVASKEKATKAVGGATYTDPVIEGTSIKNFSTTLTKPGDVVEFYFKVKNSGTINAEIGDVVFKTAFDDCLGKTTTENASCSVFDFDNNKTIDEADKTAYSEMFNYSLTYEDGSAISKGQKLNANEEKVLKLTVEYKSTATKLPDSNVTLTSATPITINFVQAN